MSSSNSKQYGLIIPKKFDINQVKRAAVFDADSDSEEESKEAGTSDWIKKSFQKQAAAQSGRIKRQTEIDMKRALDEDPTVYKYDEVYDQLEEKKAEDSKKKCDQKKPRYIQHLLKTAQQRKLENERRIERQVQKERDAEGEQFKDKETFVTSAYKKKLEEFHKLDEEERRKDVLEEICDVSKQQDLGGFYRHLYKTTVDKDTNEQPKDDNDNSNISVKENTSDSTVVVKDIKKSQRENRQYRKRKTSESSSLEEGERNSDSDTSISSSSSSEASISKKENKTKILKYDEDSDKQDSTEEPGNSEVVIKEEKSSVSSIDKTDLGVDKNSSDSLLKVEDKGETKEERPKVNIWEKRTVGPVFEAALERYFKRKAERLSIRGN